MLIEDSKMPASKKSLSLPLAYKIFLFCLALLTVSQLIRLHDLQRQQQPVKEGAAAAERIETPFDQCKSVEFEKANDFGHFKSFVKNCTHLSKYAENYPIDLERCVCGIFINKAHRLYWFSLVDPFIYRLAKSMASNWTSSAEPEGLFVDHYSKLPRERLEATLEEILKEAASFGKNRLGQAAWEQIDIMGRKYQMKDHDDYVASFLINRRCTELSLRDPIGAIWDVLGSLSRLTGTDYFATTVLEASDEPLKKVLFQKGFCGAYNKIVFKLRR